MHPLPRNAELDPEVDVSFENFTFHFLFSYFPNADSSPFLAISDH